MVANASALRDRDGVRDDRESAMRALPAGRCNGASFARAYIQRTNDASSILASAQFSRSWRTSSRLTACRYEQLTPPVARLAPPRSFSLGIWAPGMRAAGAARRASGLCRALHHSPRAGASSYGRAGKPAGGASATIGPWDLIATRRARRWVVVSESNPRANIPSFLTPTGPTASTDSCGERPRRTVLHLILPHQ